MPQRSPGARHILMVAEYRLQHVISHLNSSTAGVGRPLWVALWNLRALRNVAQSGGHCDLSRWCTKIETGLLRLHMAAADDRKDALCILKEACRHLLERARARAEKTPEPGPSERLTQWLAGPKMRDFGNGLKPYELELEVHRGKLHVHVPNPESPHDQLSLIWRLQEVLRDALPYRCVTIDVSAYREIPLSLLSVLTMIEQCLRQDGRLCIFEGAMIPEPSRRINHKRLSVTRGVGARGARPCSSSAGEVGHDRRR